MGTPKSLHTAPQTAAATRYVHKDQSRTYLIHTSISKEQCGVIQGDCGGRVHIGMLVFLEEVNKSLPDLASCQRRFHLEAADPKLAEGKAARPRCSLRRR